MSDLDKRNKTVITLGIALISLSLGAVLIRGQSDVGKVSEDRPLFVNEVQANLPKVTVTPKLKVSAKPTIEKSTGSGSPMVSPVVSQSPNLVKTPSPTPQTPVATPTPTKTPSATPIKTITPTPSQTPSNSPSPTVSLTPTPTNNNATLIINEIGWMGTEVAQSGQYGEWLEIYNPSNSQVDLSGWKILVSGELLLNLSGTISPGQYFLIERVTPSSPDPIIDIQGNIMASFGSGGLNNGGDRLELVDASGNIIDSVDCSSGWFAGSNTSPKKSMERKGPSLSGNNSGSWSDNDGVTRNGADKNGTPINGTPGMKNSQEI